MQLKETKHIVLTEIAEAINAISEEDIQLLIKQILGAKKIFLVGVGRVELALESWCKRFSHLGYDICMVGDLTEPCFGEGDLLIVGSGSGNSVIPVAIAKKAKELKGCVFHIGSNADGKIAKYVDGFLKIPVTTKLGNNDKVIKSAQLMTSLFEQSLYLLGDIIALYIATTAKEDISEYWQYHATLE